MDARLSTESSDVTGFSQNLLSEVQAWSSGPGRQGLVVWVGVVLYSSGLAAQPQPLRPRTQAHPRGTHTPETAGHLMIG